MFNREKQLVDVLTYTNDRDSYGQPRQSEPTVSHIEMMVKDYKQENVQDPRYIDCDYLGLTKDIVSDSNRVRFNGIVCDVLKVIPVKRFNMVFMKRWK